MGNPTPFVCQVAIWQLATRVELCDPEARPAGPWQRPAAPDACAWVPSIHGQDASAGADALALDEAAAPDRRQPLDALTATQVRDLRLLEACAHPEPNGGGEGSLRATRGPTGKATRSRGYFAIKGCKQLRPRPRGGLRRCYVGRPSGGQGRPNNSEFNASILCDPLMGVSAWGVDEWQPVRNDTEEA